MSISTYSELVTAVSQWLNRGTSLDTQIPNFIKLGESYLNRKLRTRDMEAVITFMTSTVDNFSPLPERFLEPISLVDDFGDELVPLDASTLEILRYQAGKYRPRYYRISTRIDFESASEQAHPYILRYWQALDLETDLTNPILEKYPEAYLYAALYYSAPYIQSDGRLQEWKALLDDTIQQANHQGQRNLQLLRTTFNQRPYTNILRGD